MSLLFLSASGARIGLTGGCVAAYWVWCAGLEDTPQADGCVGCWAVVRSVIERVHLSTAATTASASADESARVN